MKRAILFGFLGMTVAAVAAPTVSNVTLEYNVYSGMVKVDYTLSESAVVLARFYDGDTQLSLSQVQTLAGDVNRLVTHTAATLYWNVALDFPERSFDAGALKVELKVFPKDAPPQFMVIGLKATNDVRYYGTTNEIPGGIGINSTDLNRTDAIVFSRIPAKNVTFVMGSPTTEANRSEDKEVQAVTTIPYDYYLSVYTLTQAQHAHLESVNVGSYTNYEDSPLLPLCNVSYNTIRGAKSATVDWPTQGTNVLSTSILGLLRARSGVVVDLPTEAEWEYAARGGYGTGLPDGTNFTQPSGWGGANENKWGWTKSNVYNAYTGLSAGRPGPVGKFLPNRWFIYDVIGNPYEWARDWYQADRSTLTGDANWKGPDTGTSRACRAGTCFWNAEHARLAKREPIAPNQTGDRSFRLYAPYEAK